MSDYYSVNPVYGTHEEFEEFVHKAGELGIRIMIDLVVDHTSDQHPWFRAARKDPRSRYRNYYRWQEEVPTGKVTQNIFQGVEDSTWSYDDLGGGYFYHRFYHFEPSLNLGNPEVPEEICRIMEYWLSFGISGFRVDAAAHIIRDTLLLSGDLTNPHQILADMRAKMDERVSEGLLLGETDVRLTNLQEYFGSGKELNMLFNFILNNYAFLALVEENKEPLDFCLHLLPKISVDGGWVNFLRNIDELDLERLSHEQRTKVMDALDPDKKARIYDRGL